MGTLPAEAGPSNLQLLPAVGGESTLTNGLEIGYKSNDAMTDDREQPRDGIIVGGGISGLALAHWLGLHNQPGTWELWEAAGRLGGTIGTDRTEGYSVDWGPNGFLDREPLTLRLVEEIGLKEALEPANRNAESRFIAKGGRLHPVPFSPRALMTTGLLGAGAKLRILAEPFIPARRDNRDESVFDFAARRIGRAAAETFVDPMVSGIFGGLAHELSLPACFPVMHEMESRHGSLVKAMIARARKRRKSGGTGTRAGGPAGPAGRLTSFHNGLDSLVNRLGERLRHVIRLDRRAVQLAYGNSAWSVTDAGGHTYRTQRLVLACPAFAAAEILREYDPELSRALRSIPYAPIAVVASGHRRADVTHSLAGFGFLIPRGEGIRTLGSIWTSSIFAERAPSGHLQFRTMIGGAGDPHILALSDDELWDTIRSDLEPLIGIRNEPVFRRVYRWEQGIPQFTMGHLDRRTRVEQLAARHPGLFLTGNAYHGVGLNDCVKMSYRVSERCRR